MRRFLEWWLMSLAVLGVLLGLGLGWVLLVGLLAQTWGAFGEWVAVFLTLTAVFAFLGWWWETEE